MAGVVDDDDNCPNDANLDQADADGDGVGDACSGDSGAVSQPDVVTDVCGAGLCGTGSATMIPLLLLGLTMLKVNRRVGRKQLRR